MDANTQGIGQLLEKYVYPFLSGGVLTGFLAWLINRQRLPSEKRLLNSQAGVGEVSELEKRVVVTASIIDIYKEGTEDAAEQVRALKRELRGARKRNEELEQLIVLLREMKSMPPAPAEKE